MFGWVSPFVTGYKYKIHWGETGLDYDEMTIDASERWEPWDKSVYLVHNFTEERNKILFKKGGKYGDIVENNTISSNPKDWEFGQNIIYNQTEVRETHFIINGKGETNPYKK